MARSKHVFEADEGLFLLSDVIHVFDSRLRVEIAQSRGSRRGVSSIVSVASFVIVSVVDQCTFISNAAPLTQHLLLPLFAYLPLFEL